MPERNLLARFEAGELLRVDPDEQSKTCSNIDRQIVRADGVLIETSETLLDPDKPMTLEMRFGRYDACHPVTTSGLIPEVGDGDSRGVAGSV